MPLLAGISRFTRPESLKFCSISAVMSTKTPSRGHKFELVILHHWLANQPLRSCIFLVCHVCVPRPAESRFPGSVWIIWARLGIAQVFCRCPSLMLTSIMGLGAAGTDLEGYID